MFTSNSALYKCFLLTYLLTLKLLKENWLSENLNLLDCVSKFRKLKKACELVQQNLKNSRSKMKMLYDRKSQNHVFNPGGKVSVSSPSQMNKLQARNLDSYLVIKRVGTLHWTFKDCDGGQLTEICQFNMAKPYFKRGIT